MTLKHPTRGGAYGSRPTLLALLGLALLALLVPATASAKPKKPKKPAEITVMSRNVYLGADLSPAIGAASLGEAISGAGEIYRELESTDFPSRSVLLAKEINKAKPDLIGLQEVALWRVQEPGDLGWTESGGVGSPAQDVKYDFLALLKEKLPKYKVVGVQEEFDAELPADTDDNPATGDPIFGSDLDARLTMRDVIMVRKGSDVKAKAKTLKMGQFENRFVANVGGAEIAADRGWLSVEAKVKGNKKRKGASFRFVNTHLEAFGDPKIREAQAKELYAKGGPLKTKKQLVLVGDLNSGIKKHNIGAGGGGSADPDDQLAFKALKKFGMKDRGAVQTCCYPKMTEAEIGDYRFTHTVDHVLVKPAIKGLGAYVTGNDPSVTTAAGLVASDHGGVVSELRFGDKKKKGKGKGGKK
jgi:endonuclease/exonuclease/phosphatase family metal-dependent hydrolase